MLNLRCLEVKEERKWPPSHLWDPLPSRENEDSLVSFFHLSYLLRDQGWICSLGAYFTYLPTFPLFLLFIINVRIILNYPIASAV